METGVTKTKRDLSRGRNRSADLLRESTVQQSSNAHDRAIAER